MAKAVKLADIAEQLGVSTVTVSKALSGQKGVSEAMREKIKQLADELGYKQPSAVKKEKSVKSYNIGVLVSEKYLDLSELDEKEREANSKIALLEAQISQLETDILLDVLHVFYRNDKKWTNAFFFLHDINI